MNVKSAFLAASISAALVLVNSGASAHEGAFEGTIGLGEYRPDDGRSTDDATYTYVALGYYLSDDWLLEAYGAEHDSENGADNHSVSGSSYGIKGLYSFLDHERTVQPYLALGLAHVQLEEENNENGVQLGLGLKFNVNDWLRFRLEATNLRLEESHANDLQWFAGVGLSFGGKSHQKAAVVKAAPVPPPAPAPVTVVAPAAPAPLDSDKDGVVDAADQCPATPSGLSVNGKGCAELREKVSMRLNVQFDTNKAVIKSEFNNELVNIAKFMRDYPTTKVVIEGHTDNVGNAGANKTLSQRRADAVAQALSNEHGIAAERVSAIGYGQDKPLVDNKSAEGRAQNRRVTAVIDEQVVIQK